MCPRLPDKPQNCVTAEADLWREGDVEEGCCCPLLLLPNFDYELKAFNMLSHNITPSGDGWENEMYRWNQAMETIDKVIAQLQSETFAANKKG